jgi:hypothetical protein
MRAQHIGYFLETDAILHDAMRPVTTPDDRTGTLVLGYS